MAEVRIAENKVWVGETSIPLMGGEVHYWRLDPKVWRRVLERVQELGIQVLATYVCWDFHESQAGEFDFTGATHPRRNLAGYLDLLQEMGFWVIIRPGPYIYSEWPNAGIPEYATQFHRLAPEYLAYAWQYLAAVLSFIQPYLATHGGRIILCQAENELDCWPHMYTEQLGLGSQVGLFQSFLEERYPTIQVLNQAWGTSYLDFSQARAVLTLPPDRNDLLPRYLDYYRFKHWYVIRATRWVVDAFRELGVDVPILMNTIPSHANEPWAEMEKISDLVGTDLYPSNTFHRNPDEHRQFLEAVRYLRSYSRLPYISEFEAGIWCDTRFVCEVGTLQPNHYRMATVSALLAGAVGWNWYMLVNRDNWFMSPINEWGRVRVDLFSAFHQVVDLFFRVDPTSWKKLTELAVTIDPIQQAAAHPESEVLRAFYQADVDYEFYDVTTGIKANPLLFYAGGDWLGKEEQQGLYGYMQAGGHLVCVGNYPRWDDLRQPCNLLGIPEPAGIIGDMGDIDLEIRINESSFRLKSRWFAHFESVPGDPIIITRQSVDEQAVEEMQFLCNLPCGNRYTVGFTMQIGRGLLTYVALQSTKDLLVGLLEAWQVNIPTRSRTPGVSTALFQRSGKYYLAVVNTGCEDKAAEIHLRSELFQSDTVSVTDLVSQKKFKINLGDDTLAAFAVSGKDAAIFELWS